MIFSMLHSDLKKNLKLKNELIGNYENLDNDFEKNRFSRTAKNIYGSGLHSFRIVKLMAVSEKYTKKINYFDLNLSVLSVLKNGNT